MNCTKLRTTNKFTPKLSSSFRFFVLAALLLTGASEPRSQSRRLMTSGDILRVANVSYAQISPDGTLIAYTVTAVDGDTTRPTVWIVRAGSDTSQTALDAAQTNARRNPPTQLLPAGWNASNPRWSPDGRRIAFLSKDREQQSLFVVSLDNRQPRLLAPVYETNFHIAYDGEVLSWSGDGKRIAFISATDEDISSEVGAKRNDPRVIDRLQYKSRTSFSDNARTHIFIVDVDDARPDARQLTSGNYYDHALTWNPKGDEIAFLSNHEFNPDANNNSDIFAVSLNGRIRQITSTNGCEYEPQWSPDGKWIAYTATKRDITTIDSVAEDTHVWLVDSAGGRGRELTSVQDRRARSPRWYPDSQSIYFLAGDNGQVAIFRVGLRGGKIQTFAPYVTVTGLLVGRFADVPTLQTDRDQNTIPTLYKAQINSFSLTGRAYVPERMGVAGRLNTLLTFTISTPTSPPELWFGSDNNVPLRRLSSHNVGISRSTAFVDPDDYYFKSFDGTSIQAWLMKPAGFREGQSYPMILAIHGGPHGMYGYSFNAAFQVYAVRGYAVLFINPRGSSGYGQRFSDGTLREWGGGDYRDLMAGVEDAVQRFSWIDGDRLGVTGGSYGGFMTNWIITQSPRFKAAVAVASVSNLISFYGTSLYQDLIHAEFGLPWDDYDLLWRWSPLRYVRQAQTPTLFLHGEQDNDMHITQAEEMYMALRRRSVETQLVRYPREGHSFKESRHRVDALDRTIAWFDKFLR